MHWALLVERFVCVSAAASAAAAADDDLLLVCTADLLDEEGLAGLLPTNQQDLFLCLLGTIVGHGRAGGAPSPPGCPKLGQAPGACPLLSRGQIQEWQDYLEPSLEPN